MKSLIRFLSPLIVFIIIFWTVPGCGGGSSGSGSLDFEGKLLIADSREPIANVAVSDESNEGDTAVTQADGSFVLSVDSADLLRLRFKGEADRSVRAAVSIDNCIELLIPSTDVRFVTATFLFQPGTNSNPEICEGIEVEDLQFLTKERSPFVPNANDDSNDPVEGSESGAESSTSTTTSGTGGGGSNSTTTSGGVSGNVTSGTAGTTGSGGGDTTGTTDSSTTSDGGINAGGTSDATTGGSASTGGVTSAGTSGSTSDTGSSSGTGGGTGAPAPGSASTGGAGTSGSSSGGDGGLVPDTETGTEECTETVTGTCPAAVN